MPKLHIQKLLKKSTIHNKILVCNVQRNVQVMLPVLSKMQMNRTLKFGIFLNFKSGSLNFPDLWVGIIFSLYFNQHLSLAC